MLVVGNFEVDEFMFQGGDEHPTKFWPEMYILFPKYSFFFFWVRTLGVILGAVR